MADTYSDTYSDTYAGDGSTVASFAGAGSLAAVVVQVRSAQALFVGLGSASATVASAASAAFAGAGVLAATFGQSQSITAMLSGSGVLSAQARAAIAVSALATGSGSLSAVVSAATPQGVALAALLTSSGSATALLVQQNSVPAALTGSGSLGVQVLAVVAVAANLTGTGVMSGVASSASSTTDPGKLAPVAQLGGTGRASMATALEYWLGSREHQAVTIASNGAAVTDYDVALVRYPTLYADTDWHPNVAYAGRRGVWLEPNLGAGVYRIWARAGTGSPNERVIVFCGFINIRSR